MWVIHSECSRHMYRNKKNFRILKRFDEGFVCLDTIQKGEVVGVNSITLSLSCDLSEVQLVDRLKHNLININELCDVRFNVSFNTTNCTIIYPTKDITIVEDRVDNIYILNNIYFSTLTHISHCCVKRIFVMAQKTWSYKHACS